MNRRRFVLCGLLLLGIGATATAWGQESERTGLAKRLLNLRNSLTSSSEETTDDEDNASGSETSDDRYGRSLNRTAARQNTGSTRPRVAPKPQTTAPTPAKIAEPPVPAPPTVEFDAPNAAVEQPSEWEDRATTPPSAPPIDRYSAPSRMTSKRLGAMSPTAVTKSPSDARPSPPTHQPTTIPLESDDLAENARPIDDARQPGEPRSADTFVMEEMTEDSQTPIVSDTESTDTFTGTEQSTTPRAADSNPSYAGEAKPSRRVNSREVWDKPESTNAADEQSESMFGDSSSEAWGESRSQGSDSLFGDDESHANKPGDNVLLVNQTPMITSNVSGPKQIMVGREASYRIVINNQGKMAAEQMVVVVFVPSWAEVIDTSVTDGIVQRAADAQSPNTLRWQLQRLAGNSEQSLELKLVPQTTRPMELGVTWTHAPVDSRTVVEVQEPKLEMHVNGPDEVLFGKPQLYRLTLTNPGTGMAENVKIDLLPPGGGSDSISSHVVGNLRPGTSKSVEVELTAREAGKLIVKAVASAAGGLSSEAAKEIFCRKPELDVDWRGPAKQYAGTMATFFFRVRNPGTAAAQDVTVEVQLPPGSEFIGASEGQSFDKDRNRVTWRVGSLRPGDDYYMDLRCLVNNAGANRLNVVAITSDGMLSNHKSAETTVVALADLILDVTDPKGPIPVGKEVAYEIRVQNRGTSAAENVNIVALFSDGIEPHAAEGAQFGVADGRVSFKAIDKLSAGQSAILRIRARATKPGTHIFRAEVLCTDLDTKLAAEETTKFFIEDIVGGRTGAVSTAQRQTMFESQAR